MSLFQGPWPQVWNSQLQYRYLYYCHRTEHLLLNRCFWSWRKLHLRKSATRKSMFRSNHSELTWKKISSKSRQNLWKMLAKEPTVQQSCRLEVCSSTKNKLSHSHPPRILSRSWVLIYDAFKNLRAIFFPEYFFSTLPVFVIVMLSLRTLTKYNLSGIAHRDSSFQLNSSIKL